MLKDLCALNATSGREEAVRDYLIAHLPKEVEYFVDPLGSLIVKKKGKRGFPCPRQGEAAYG